MIYECIGKYAKNPYYIDEICMNLFSVEEVCYYLYENALLIDDSVMKQDLCDFIERELGLTELGRKLSALLRAEGSLSAFVSMILEDTAYCSREELKRIESALRDNASMGPLKRKKMRGDYLFANGKFSLAAGEYKQALEDECGADELTVKADVYHNLGVAYARMFLFDLAAQSFLKSCELEESEDTYEQYLAALRLGKSKDQYLDFVVKHQLNQESVAKLEEKVRKLAEQSRGTKEYMEYRQALALKDEGKVAEYYKALGSVLSKWKQEYRKNMIHE